MESTLLIITLILVVILSVVIYKSYQKTISNLEDRHTFSIELRDEKIRCVNDIVNHQSLNLSDLREVNRSQEKSQEQALSAQKIAYEFQVNEQREAYNAAFIRQAEEADKALAGIISQYDIRIDEHKARIENLQDEVSLWRERVLQRPVQQQAQQPQINPNLSTVQQSQIPIQAAQASAIKRFHDGDMPEIKFEDESEQIDS